MSSADPEEVSVEIGREGVTVEKSFEPDDFPVPAIAFVIRSERDVPVDVTLVDTVPEDIQAEDIGFHPRYGAEHWRNEGEELIFERQFEAGEEYTTVYGLRARDTEDVGRFLGDPELTEVNPPKDSGQVVRDVIGEGVEPDTSDDDLEAAIAAADVEGPQERSTDDGPAETAGTASVSPGTVASALAEGIRAGRVSDSDLEVLREALGSGDGSSNSLEARIDHLQSEVADLNAYSDALEEFIDENGEARTLMRDLQDSIEGIRSDVAEVEASVESVSGEVTEANERLDDLDDDISRIDDIEASVESVSGEVAEANGRLDEIDEEISRIEDVESSMESVSGEVTEANERLDEIDEEVSRIDDVEEEVASIGEEVDEVRGEVDEVRDEIPEGRIEAIDDRIDELQTELDELAEMRQRMASVFGGMGEEPTETESDEAGGDETDEE